MEPLRLIYYLDVLSSWCTVAEPALANLRDDLGKRLELDWRIAILFEGKAMGYTQQMNVWYYRRTESVSGIKLSSAWRESAQDVTWHANLATQAARALGVTDDRVRLAMSRAAMVHGKHVGRRDVAISVASEASGLSADAIERAMEDPATAQQIWTWTAEYKALGVEVQPAFLFRNAIGDSALLSGLFHYETLRSCAAEMLAAADGYASFGAANPAPKE